MSSPPSRRGFYMVLAMGSLHNHDRDLEALDEIGQESG